VSGRLYLDAQARQTLEGWVRAKTAPQRLALRSRIVLALADGLSARQAARDLQVSRHTVDLWRARFLSGGCNALVRDKPGRGRKKLRPKAQDE
jgi:transposase